MKKIITAIFLFSFSITCYAAVSWKTATQMYEGLIKNNYLKRPTVFRLIESDELNAWASPDGSVNITTADLKILTRPELALILGHELAHIQFNDTHHSLGGTVQEDRADHYGMYYAENIGYSRCKQAYFFLRLYRLYGNSGGNGDPHSKNLIRFWNIYKGCK